MAEKRRGLGRGIGALIPEAQEEKKTRPIDVFFNNPATAKAEPNDEGKPERITTEGTKPARPPRKSAGTSSAKKTSSTTKPRATKKVTAEEAVSKSGSKESAETAAAQVESAKPLVPVPGATFGEIDVTLIVPNQKQPRQIFDEDELEELASSIKEVGVLQPIVVRPLNTRLDDAPDARYELIMGERRWRASQLAGNATVPAIVRRTEDSDLLRDALLENLHRSQLNPLEEAAAYQQLLDDFNCTQDELSRRIARSRPQISNTLRLLKLPPLVQRRVAAGILSAGHARALLGLTDPAAMERLAQRIVAEGLSVRATEEIVALGDDQAPVARRGRVSQYEDELNEVAGRLADRFDTKVKVNMGQRKGRIAIDFGSIDDLNRILAQFNEDGVHLSGQDL